MSIGMLNTTYDVVIVGSGIAGIEVCSQLCNSTSSILLVDRRQKVDLKPCAEGVTSSDLRFLSPSVLSLPLQSVDFHWCTQSATLSSVSGILSTIRRSQYLADRQRELRERGSISMLLDTRIADIDLSRRTLVLSSGQRVSFETLIGADGSRSVVRKAVGWSVNRCLMAMHYRVPAQLNRFEFHFDEELFRAGYGWVFPNRSYTSIGCCCDMALISPRELRQRFNWWITQRGFDLQGATFRAAPISFDYRGYRTDKTFLIGDAAGLASGMTGKGIYAALLSARRIAAEILGRDDYAVQFEEWLKKKGRQEQMLTDMYDSVQCRRIHHDLIEMIAQAPDDAREIL